jgi:hypothetical protein
MTVVHTGDKLSLETKLITSEGERVVADSYMLDGKEVEFTPKTPNGDAGKGKRPLVRRASIRLSISFSASR